MAITAFTPGPWCLSPLGTKVRREVHGYNICEVNEALDEEALPTARLIAAAPTMLEALQLAETAICAMDGYACAIVRPSEQPAAGRAIADIHGVAQHTLPALRAALKKAGAL